MKTNRVKRMKTNRVKRVSVHVGESYAGVLEKNAQFAFTYDPKTHPDKAVSLVMPVRTASYSANFIHPVFEMNIPEGYLKFRILEHFRKVISVDEVFLLALQGRNGIGHLSYQSDYDFQRPESGESLDEILGWDGSEDLFELLLNKYLLTTTIAGVQPKVVVPEVQHSYKGTLLSPSLIIKTGRGEYPGLAVNEYVCMRIAEESGLRVPEFWLSKNEDLFIMRRFDLDSQDPSKKLGMEDFCVLVGLPAERKYEKSYEIVAKAINLYSTSKQEDLREFFKSLVVTCLVGNGDAHLKNFSMLYTTTKGERRLSPAYDIVSTQVYIPQDQLALKLNKKKIFPNRSDLIEFGNVHCLIPKNQAADIIDGVLEAATAVLDECRDLAESVDDGNGHTLADVIDRGMALLDPSARIILIPQNRSPRLY